MANEPAMFSPSSLAYVEGVYANYLRDPASAPPAWQHYFAALTNGELNGGPAMSEPAFHSYSVFNPPAARRAGPAELSEPAVADLQERVDSLIRSYRSRGHIIAQIDPLRQPKGEPPELDPAYHGLTAADLNRPFACATMEPEHLLPLREIIERLRSTYCRSIGVQFMHIDDYAMRYWLQEQMERTQNRLALSRNDSVERSY